MKYKALKLECTNCHKPVIVTQLNFNAVGDLKIIGACKGCTANVEFMTTVADIVHTLFYHEVTFANCASQRVQ
jgi:hypothetical protein